MTRVDQWVNAPLPSEVRDAIVRLERSDGITRLAVMPDVHLSRDVCVGLVVASPIAFIRRRSGETSAAVCRRCAFTAKQRSSKRRIRRAGS